MNDTDDTFNVYKGKGLHIKHKKTNTAKIFVFDLDETIGSFSDLYILFKCIKSLNEKYNITLYDSDEILLFHLLDEFPEFFRYGISVLFKYLNEKKKRFSNINIYIYTNNTCIPINWTSIIVKYIEQKWDLSLFDNIIRCFKINDKIIEHKRTTTKKTYCDLIKCIKLSTNTELCFIDNVLFPAMRLRHVYYLCPKPYYHYVNNQSILTQFIASNIGQQIYNRLNITSEKLFENIHSWYIQNGYSFDTFIKSKEEMEIDIEVSKKLLYHCRLFFNITIKTIKTKKNNVNFNVNKTQKIKQV